MEGIIAIVASVLAIIVHLFKENGRKKKSDANKLNSQKRTWTMLKRMTILAICSMALVGCSNTYVYVLEEREIQRVKRVM